MSNCISYSLFGYNEKHAGSLDFNSYLRGLAINIRVAELLYPGWTIHLSIDEQTFLSPYKEFFMYHVRGRKLKLLTFGKQPLCIMMLHRLWPVFDAGYYDRVVCRDTDSLLSYRERQAVKYWEEKGNIVHAITDSISHTIPLMGGMIGIVSKQFREAIGCKNFKEMMSLESGIDYTLKGSDQTFLNRVILPKVAHSMTEHYVRGMPQSFRSDCHNHIQDIDLGLPEAYKETNALGWHIGASGFQTDATIKFLAGRGKDNEYYEAIEKKFPHVFYWHL